MKVFIWDKSEESFSNTSKVFQFHGKGEIDILEQNVSLKGFELWKSPDYLYCIKGNGTIVGEIHEYDYTAFKSLYSYYNSMGLDMHKIIINGEEIKIFLFPRGTFYLMSDKMTRV